MKIIFSLLLLTVIVVKSGAQTKIDSLKKADSISKAQKIFFKSLNRFKGTAITNENFKKYPKIQQPAAASAETE